jgi:hypothetical protein
MGDITGTGFVWILLVRGNGEMKTEEEIRSNLKRLEDMQASVKSQSHSAFTYADLHSTISILRWVLEE